MFPTFSAGRHSTVYSAPPAPPGDVIASLGPAISSGAIPDSARMKNFFVWPDDDYSYVKLIWKHPTPKYPQGFHVLGTRFHPIGDFDREDVRLPDEPLRIYKTLNGWRVFFTGRYNVDVNSMFDELDALGGDPLYSKYARMRKYFAMRIEPKVVPTPFPGSIAKLVEAQGTPHPEWERLIEIHDQLVNAHDPNSVLV